MGASGPGCRSGWSIWRFGRRELLLCWSLLVTQMDPMTGLRLCSTHGPIGEVHFRDLDRQNSAPDVKIFHIDLSWRMRGVTVAFVWPQTDQFQHKSKMAYVLYYPSSTKTVPLLGQSQCQSQTGSWLFHLNNLGPGPAPTPHRPETRSSDG